MTDVQTIFGFVEPADIQGWWAIDDRIMGGSSLSRPEFIPGGGMRFRGFVSLDNNAGFASIRSPESNYDLRHREGLRMYVRGDGKRYKLGLRTDRYFDGISYQAGFTTMPEQWAEVVFSFTDFVATHHGLRLTTVAPLDPALIQSFGLFIADRQQGPFQLDVAWIRAE